MPETLTRAWAQQVLDEHRELRRKKITLRNYLAKARPNTGETGAHTWAAGLTRQLVILHDELFRHFRFEEDEGMAEEITTRHPRAATDLDRLMGEHSDLLREVREAMEQALTYSEGRELADPSLRQRVTRILDRLESHETEENDMIYKLELEDLGRGW